MSHTRDRVEYLPNDTVKYSSSSQPKKSHAPPPPINRSQPTAQRHDHRDSQQSQGSVPKYDDQVGPRKSGQPERYDAQTQRKDYHQSSAHGQPQAGTSYQASGKPQGYKSPSQHQPGYKPSSERHSSSRSQHEKSYDRKPQGSHEYEQSLREPKAQQHYSSQNEVHKNPSSSWEPRAQRRDPSGQQYQSQHDLSEQSKRAPTQRQYVSQSDLSKNPPSSWEPRAQRKDPSGQQYQSQHDLSVPSRNEPSQRPYTSQSDLSGNRPSWEPRAHRKSDAPYQSQHSLNSGSRNEASQQRHISQDEPHKKPHTSWEPRANRSKPSGDQYASQPDLKAPSLSKSQQNLSSVPDQSRSKAQSTADLTTSNPANLDVKENKNGDGRRYQRNSAYKPQQNRHSSNLAAAPAGSTQSLYDPRGLGQVNPALSRSAVSLNPSANAAGLAGQGDLSGGLSTSRLSLASQNIARNPSMASLVASNPSLYRTVSTLSLYEAGVAEPSTYLPITIAGCILCCPIGVIGILFSVMARDALHVKDYPAAVRWGSIALWTGVAFIVGGIVLILTLSLILGLYYST